MKDLIVFIMMGLIWNSPIHTAHPTLIPVLFTLYFVMIAIEVIIEFLKEE